MSMVSTSRPGSGRKHTPGRHDALRAALLEAGERAIEREGLNGLRARALADAAGCALGAIYTVFPDLDALVLGVNARTLDAIDRALRDPPPEGPPAAVLMALAERYLDYVAQHPRRCAALFSHVITSNRPVPDDYLARQSSLFANVEGPLARLRPDVPTAALPLLARTLFSAVHGIVSLGLDQKLAPIGEARLRAHLRLMVGAMAAGLGSAGI